MMKRFSAFLATLLCLSMGLTGAQEIKLDVSSDRNAALHVKTTDSPNPEVSGTVKSTADFKAGKSSLIGDLLLKTLPPEAKDAKGSFYTQLTAKTIEAIGYVNTKVPMQPDAPKSLTVDAKTVTEGDQSAADFKFDMVAPYKEASPAPSGKGQMKFDGDFKAFKSSGDFDLSADDIKAADAGFQDLTFEITEVENKTTITCEVKVPKTSPSAAQLDQLPTYAPQLEGGFKQMGLKYEGIDFPKPTEEGDLKVGKFKFTLIDWRQTLNPYLGLAAGQMQAQVGPDVDVKAAMEKMLTIKLDKIGTVIHVEDKKINGKFDVNLSSLDTFYEGYAILAPALQQESNQQLAREMGEFGPLFLSFMQMTQQQAAQAVRVAAQSTLSLEGNAEFSVAPKEKDLSISVQGNVLSKNYQDFVTKAKAAGLPVAEKAVGDLNLTLDAQGALKGDVYFYTDGELLAYYKGMLSKAAESSNTPKEVVDVIKTLELNQVTFKTVLEAGKLSMQGKSDTSDLTPLIKQILAKAAPQVEASLVGASVDVNIPEGQKTEVDFRAFFAQFLPGKSDAQIKEALGLPSSVKITMDAPAEGTKLVAVEQPEITVDGQLAEVQSAGQKLLASSPADIGGGGGVGGGGSKTGLIALGALLLVGVGGFLMFGKKS